MTAANKLGPSVPVGTHEEPRAGLSPDGPRISAATALRCIKCGGASINTSFHPRRSYCDPHNRYTFNCAEGEHLHRYCLTCHYDWTEDCADAR